VTTATNNLKIGAVYSRQSFGTIVGQTCDSVQVRNEDGMEWSISRSIFDEEFVVADVVASESIVNQTELIEQITKNPRTAMTIHFRKKVVPSDVTKALRTVLEDVEPGSRKFASAVKEAVAGEPRTMIGRHYGDFDDRGRLQFIEHGKGLRLVDPRTVEFAIVRGVKYATS
jgi:hypothetical protein